MTQNQQIMNLRHNCGINSFKEGSMNDTCDLILNFYISRHFKR